MVERNFFSALVRDDWHGKNDEKPDLFMTLVPLGGFPRLSRTIYVRVFYLV